MRLDTKEHQVSKDLHSTDAFNEHAIDLLTADVDQKSKQAKEPFILHLAHNTLHFSLHAPPDDLAKYQSCYRAVWDTIRQRRFQ